MLVKIILDNEQGEGQRGSPSLRERDAMRKGHEVQTLDVTASLSANLVCHSCVFICKAGLPIFHIKQFGLYT